MAKIPWPESWRVPPPVEEVEGGYRVNLGRIEQRVLHQTLDDLRELLTERDESTRRLFPRAHADDPALEAEYQQLVGDDLARSQLEAIGVVERTLDGTTVDRDELEQWMRSVNAVRLVLGTQVDVTEDMDPPGPDDPDYAAFGVYEFLTELLAWIIEVLGRSGSG